MQRDDFLRYELDKLFFTETDPVKLLNRLVD
jgi:hypothetical protein